MKHKVSGFLLLFSLFAVSPLFSSESVRFKTSVSPRQVTVGDEIRYTMRLEIPAGTKVEPFHPKLSLPPFEIKRIETTPSAHKPGVAAETRTLVLTVFEWGELTIPPLSLIVTDPQGLKSQISTSPQHVKVVSVPKRARDKGDIRTIKGPVSLDLGFYRAVAMGFLAALLAVVLAVKVILRRRKKTLEDLESRKPPRERAHLELERLKAKAFLETGKVKDYYSELADILRRYLQRQFGIETLELTTIETLSRLKEREFDRASIGRIQAIFENSDLVKFAKHIPPKSLTELLTVDVTRVVEDTAPKEEGPKAPAEGKGKR